ncbi:MAG: metallophosphoesterase family protein [Alphaproteobacteria bacterium]|nr:metallophosphoesterase family protein [Alphaproteobacteria bacterium]
MTALKQPAPPADWTALMQFPRLAPWFEKQKPAVPVIPRGVRLYVIGDIHGRLDLLNDLERQISSDLETAPAEVQTIFLGDYVDRGGESAGVIERLSAGDFCTAICPLRGNHEEVFLQFLSNASVLASWRKIGGLETLHSYGVDVGEAMRGIGYDRAQAALIEKLPQRHREFLEKTRLSFTLGDYFFSHAGIRPDVDLERQSAEDLLWIRNAFLQFQGDFGKIVVHGHTPTPTPEVRPNRINIDTGAYASSVLTALILEGETRRFLATGPADASRE